MRKFLKIFGMMLVAALLIFTAIPAAIGIYDFWVVFTPWLFGVQ